MANRTVSIASQHGLHARPAALFTKSAAESGIAVKVAKDGKSANAASILEVITLGANCGDEVTLTAEGDGADSILDKLADLLSTPDPE